MPKNCLTICVGAIKGGAGKTTTAVALAQCAATDGKKVLLIDLDPQCNATMASGAAIDPNGALALLHKQTANTQHTEQGMDVLAAAPDLVAEKTGHGTFGRLNEALADYRKKYDLIIIDTAPAISECLYNALFAANVLIVPMEADQYSIQGLLDIAALYNEAGKYNKALKRAGAVVTRYDGRPKIRRIYRDAIATKGDAAGIPLIGTVRAGVAVPESQALERNLFEYAPNSKPAQDYRELYKTILRG